jgi:hypothetical protein
VFLVMRDAPSIPALFPRAQAGEREGD